MTDQVPVFSAVATFGPPGGHPDSDMTIGTLEPPDFERAACIVSTNASNRFG